MITRPVVLFILMAALLVSPRLYAERLTRDSLWLPWFHSQSLSSQYAVVGDLQLRSDDQQQRAENIIGRVGLHRHLGGGMGLTAGYAWNEVRPGGGDSRVEHRLWQQGLYSHGWGEASLHHRLRLEQRFLPAAGDGRQMAQRLRYFSRVQLPPPPGLDQQRYYLALQNEVFVNVQNRSRVNGQVFDQNRAYAALGYRLRGRNDIELGYMNQYIRGRDQQITNHIAQLALYTRF